MLAMMSFTVITPFYSAIAVRQGIPESLIGYIFSAFPVASFFISFILPRAMIVVGRTPVYVFGMCLLAFSNLAISNLPFWTGTGAIVLSFVSRIASGLGSACETVSSYPQDVNQLVSLIEIIGGLGAILGPTVGSMLFALAGFTNSCFYVGLGILIWTPGLYYVVGPSRPYIISTDKISLKKIWTKPVCFI
jgi:MFS family permease